MLIFTWANAWANIHIHSLHYELPQNISMEDFSVDLSLPLELSYNTQERVTKLYVIVGTVWSH